MNTTEYLWYIPLLRAGLGFITLQIAVLAAWWQFILLRKKHAPFDSGMD